MLLIKNDHVVDPKSDLDQVADVLAGGEKIIKIVDPIEEASTEVIDTTGFVVAPGLADIHVCFRRPGQIHKEGIHTGALTAAAGGFISVVMAVNTNPTISDVKILKKVLASAAEEDMYVHTNAIVMKNFDGRHLTDSKAFPENGAFSFSDDDTPPQSTKASKKALDLAKANNIFVTVHGENPELSGISGFSEHVTCDKFHFCGATDVAEHSMIACDIMTAYDRDTHLHIQHLSKAEPVKVVEFAQQLGANITAGAAPQHFSKIEDLLLIKDSAAKMNPPFRTEKDRLAVIEGLKSGIISVITTDHTSHHADEKNVDDIAKAPSGVIEFGTSLPLGPTNLVATGGLTLFELLVRMTINLPSMYGFDVRYLVENDSVDVVIFVDKEECIISDHFTSKTPNSPFIGEKLQGVVKCTVCDGKIVYQAS